MPAVRRTHHGPFFSSLCIACPPQPLAPHLSGPAFHTNRSLCTAFLAPLVEVVGNRGRSTPIPSLFSNSPQFHSLDLENSPACQPFLFQPFQPYFHFSCLNDGYYCLISLSHVYFPIPHRISLVHLQTLPLSRPDPSEVSIGLSRSTNPGNPEKHPSFPRSKQRKGEYNQEEEKRTVSVRRLLVVQCGQCGFYLNRFLR